ncbi:MAG: beta-N-acetylhexosaminidase [Verrucomicrobiales bacterium]|jgi:hypothetical protein|nr:beta-N-acetylhexosaminidase [Verrucomicrobiales bacterium]
MMLDLLPPPKIVRLRRGFCAGRKNRKTLGALGRRESGSYRLIIGEHGTRIDANDEAGLFYAEQTLRQIDHQFPKARPCLVISDWPDYPVRGFYHDITRGKVPKLKTLFQLADTCAHYKLNHLELYIEHTYAFKLHREIWHDADPLTAKDIRKLDAYCAKLHIDLVPSFSTFGHFYTWIHRKFPELNELERDVSGEPFNFHDRMVHYTLDCQNPLSIKLVEEIIREVRPLFRSRYFNICADETFDLGKGRNRKAAERLGVHRLYLDYLKKVLRIVNRQGSIPLFWGDVVDLGSLGEIPVDAVILDWDYAARPSLHRTPLFGKSGRTFYVCPGINGWNRWLPDYRAARQNITRFTKAGLDHGAAGMLNTDWGDYGHIQSLGPTIPGIAMGAAASWHARSGMLKPGRLLPAISRLEFCDSSGQLLGLFEEAVSAGKASWAHVCNAFQPPSKDFPDSFFDGACGLPKDFFRYPARVHTTTLKKLQALDRKIRPLLRKISANNLLLVAELKTGLLGLQVMEEYFLFRQYHAGKTRLKPLSRAAMSGRLRKLEQQLSGIWLRRNRPSEYFRVREILLLAEKSCHEI